MLHKARTTGKKQLTFYKHSKAPLLFLEWLSEYQRKAEIHLAFSIREAADMEEVLNDRMVITFDAIPTGAVHIAVAYINSNLR